MSGSLNKVELIGLYVTQKLSIPQIAEKLALPRSRVRTMLIRNGIPLRSRKEGIQLRSDHLSEVRTGTTYSMTDERRANISKALLAYGERNAVGTRITASGYLEYTRGPHKGRLVHDVEIEKTIGRRIMAGEHVHHCDRNKLNNEISNLRLMTRAEHIRLHRLEDGHSLRGKC